MATITKEAGRNAPKARERRYVQVETSCVQDNHALALSVGRQDVGRCAEVIQQYGLLRPPVVGILGDGGQVLLAGECEFLAMREMGAKSVEAVAVPITENGEGDKLALMLSSLKESPCALSEGMLVSRLFKTGRYTQSQLGRMIGKSTSWVNKRISLVTRLEPPVMELVKLGRVCPRSAQEISRLPAWAQHSFSVATVKEGLPKSSVEALVAAFNAPACPDWAREQILTEPRQALARLHDVDSPTAIRRRLASGPLFPGENVADYAGRFRHHLAEMKAFLSDPDAAGRTDSGLWESLRNDVATLLSMLDSMLSPSPQGGREWGCGGHGH